MLTDFRERGKGRREGDMTWEKNSICLPSVHTLTRDWTCNLGYVPWLGIEPTTFWCIGWRSNQLSHLARTIVPRFFVFFFFNISLIYFQREEKGGGKRERETSMWLPLTCPQMGSSLQPRDVPRLGVQPGTLWSTGQHSIYWATPARAGPCCFLNIYFILFFKKVLFIYF